MMRYQEIVVGTPVSEAAIARVGDLPNVGLSGRSISEFVFTKDWIVVGKLPPAQGGFTIARHSAMPSYIAGQMQAVTAPTKLDPNATANRFMLVFDMEMAAVKYMRFRDKGQILGYPNLHQVRRVEVAQNLQGRGIAKYMYRWLVKDQGIPILGDHEQYFGARRLWAALSQDTDIVVDIVDWNAVSVVDRDVVLHHGRYDADFDQRVWSYGTDKEHLLLVLRDLL